jgi:hypothetical protein
MLIFLCRLEWRALTRDTRSIAAIMLLIICTAYGVYTGESWRQERALDHDRYNCPNAVPR